MAKPLVPDALWERIEPLLPAESPKPRGGRPPKPDRAVLTGILFVLRTGIPWEYLPKEMGCGSGMTCWRRLRDWNEAGIWVRLYEVILEELGRRGEIDWSRASLDASSVPAKGGARRLGPARRTGANWARSTTCSSTETASH
jgi:transposase